MVFRGASGRARALACCLLLGTLSAGSLASAQPGEIVRRVGRVAVRVDTSRGFPGGVLVVRVGSTGRLGAVWALLDGRRAPFFLERGLARAFVPVALGTDSGPATLGIGIAARRGEQRIAIPIEIRERRYPRRTVLLPETARALLSRSDLGRDGRRLLGFIRTESREPAVGPLRPPVDGAGSGFGELREYLGAAEAEGLSDALTGEHHRGIDYTVLARTTVRSPAAGTVVFAGPLALPGQTLVIDHGQGVVSALLHLSRLDVRAGEQVAAGAPVALSGASGLASGPLLEWRVYLHGVAVDPLVLGEVVGIP
jgi:hypothetical protein